MRRMLAALAMALAAHVLPAAAQAPESPVPADIGTRLLDGFVAPALAGFVDAAVATEGSVDALCNAPDAERLQATREGFGDLVGAWGRVSVLRFGPLSADARFERLFFWPDTRGVILRQVQATIAEEDQSALSVASLGEKSVALQGLPALEYVLFGSGSEALAAGADYRCSYAKALAGNVAAIAQEAVSGWTAGTPFHASFTEPAADRDPYRSKDEVANELVKALGTGSQFIRAAELLPPLGESVEKARGKRAPFWRSDLTFDLVSAQIGGLVDLLGAAGLEAENGPARGVAASIRFDLEHARSAIESIASPAESAFEEPEDRGRIEYVTVALEGAKHAVAEQLSPALGLTMGFNALDGD